MANTKVATNSNSQGFVVDELRDSVKKLIIWGAITMGLTLLREWLARNNDFEASTTPSTSPKAQRIDPTDDEVDYASDQSFPASDPPSWTQHH